jgi:hypothetical protein
MSFSNSKCFANIVIDTGRDTTAATLSWFVYLLGNNPGVADKVYEELHLLEQDANIDESLTLNERILQYASLLTYDVLLKLQYLHAAITETIRLYPAVPQVLRPHSLLALVHSKEHKGVKTFLSVRPGIFHTVSSYSIRLSKS